MLLKVQDLSYSREKRNILHNVSLEIEKGKITCILGANGSGKSTFLSLLAGLLEPDSGTIYFNENQVLSPSKKLVAGHSNIALVKQDSRLTPFATVRENLLHILRKQDEKTQHNKINDFCNLLGLESFMDRVVKFLSGGEQQRVAIAAALASNPDILLMDEPFSQTDIFLKNELKNYLFQIVEKLGIAILFVTHNPEDALSMSNAIHILHEKSMIENGSSKELYYKPVNKSTAYLTGYSNFVSCKKVNLKGIYQIYNEYLIRPEQIKFTIVKKEHSIEVKVKKIEFSGFFYLLILFVPEWQTDLISTISTNKIAPKVGDRGWISISTTLSFQK